MLASFVTSVLMRAQAPTLVALILAGVCTACAPEPARKIWWRPGFTTEQFAADRKFCRLSADEYTRIETPTYLDVQRQKELNREFFLNCLRAKGYRLYQRDDEAPKGGVPQGIDV